MKNFFIQTFDFRQILVAEILGFPYYHTAGTTQYAHNIMPVVVNK